MIFLVNFGTVPTMCYLFFNLLKEYLKCLKRFYDITWFGAVCSSIVINTHYIHSVVVQYFVSGRASFVNQYHYESWCGLFTQQARPDTQSWFFFLPHKVFLGYFCFSNVVERVLGVRGGGGIAKYVIDGLCNWQQPKWEIRCTCYLSSLYFFLDRRIRS